jgi:CheY-like chemotaxis protein/signal recognition particle receptor subunit beta
MPLYNRATNEVTLKLVYYGPGLAGKTTNLRWIHEHAPLRKRGKLVSLATQADLTLFFDFVPLEPAPIAGLRPRIQVYTVPGRVFYETTRRMVLEGCDAVVFVADSQASMLDANVESLRGLRQNLLANDLDPALPQVVQYNKRDLSTALPLALLEAQLNPRRLPRYEAVAVEGVGVRETLAGITALVFERLDRPSRPRPRPAPAAASPGPESASSAGTPEDGIASLAAVAAPRAPSGPALVRDGDPPPDGRGLRPDQWLYLQGGRQRGPVTLDELVDLVLGSIPEDSKVWRPGLAGWVNANRVGVIADEIPPEVPRAASAMRAPAEDDMPDFDSVPSLFRAALIADEDAVFRRYLAMPLAAQGFTIYEAGDGAAAWQLAVQHRPWIILADLSMPELDGFEFCRRVRSHPLLARTPLVFISGSDKYRERHRALQSGADDFLSKTTPIRELLIRMQLLMTRYSDLGTPHRPEEERAPSTVGALEGRVEAFGAPTLVRICNQGRLTGVLSVSTSDGEPGAAALGFRDGEIISARVGDLTRTEAVYVFLTWTQGSFHFAPGDPGPSTPLAPTEQLLLEGSRRLEESRRGGTETA